MNIKLLLRNIYILAILLLIGLTPVNAQLGNYGWFSTDGRDGKIYFSNGPVALPFRADPGDCPKLDHRPGVDLKALGSDLDIIADCVGESIRRRLIIQGISFLADERYRFLSYALKLSTSAEANKAYDEALKQARSGKMTIIFFDAAGLITTSHR